MPDLVKKEKYVQQGKHAITIQSRWSNIWNKHKLYIFLLLKHFDNVSSAWEQDVKLVNFFKELGNYNNTTSPSWRNYQWKAMLFTILILQKKVKKTHHNSGAGGVVSFKKKIFTYLAFLKTWSDWKIIAISCYFEVEEMSWFCWK